MKPVTSFFFNHGPPGSDNSTLSSITGYVSNAVGSVGGTITGLAERAFGSSETAPGAPSTHGGSAGSHHPPAAAASASISADETAFVSWESITTDEDIESKIKQEVENTQDNTAGDWTPSPAATRTSSPEPRVDDAISQNRSNPAWFDVLASGPVPATTRGNSREYHDVLLPAHNKRFTMGKKAGKKLASQILAAQMDEDTDGNRKSVAMEKQGTEGEIMA
ncbi:hypothetical protein HDU93_000269 [Gonapodya sp. JEL0774]|nr:hypothetical protein HDU93_000269 [Gonapodya sp. JEL0774]